MRNKPGLAALLVTTFGGLAAHAQQLAFTSRTHLLSPVVVESIQSSREYGFESILVKNDGPDAVVAVRFVITLHSSAGDEIADERRVAMEVAAHETKRVETGLGHIKGLQDRLQSERQKDGLAIISVAAVEFRDGSEWKPPDGSNSDVPAKPATLERKK